MNVMTALKGDPGSLSDALPRLVRVICRLLIADRSGRVLLGRYACGRGEPEWTLPGGAALSGEAIGLAGTRRLHEQFGVLSWPHCLVSVTEKQDGAGGAITVVHAASIMSGDPIVQDTSKVLEAGWFSPGDLPESVAAEVLEALSSRGSVAACAVV